MKLKPKQQALPSVRVQLSLDGELSRDLDSYARYFTQVHGQSILQVINLLQQSLVLPILHEHRLRLAALRQIDGDPFSLQLGYDARETCLELAYRDDLGGNFVSSGTSVEAIALHYLASASQGFSLIA